MSKLSAIADAVVTALNAATLSQSFTAEKLYDPEIDLEGMGSTVYVHVVPRSLEGQLADRGRLKTKDYGVDVAVRKRVGGVSETDAMMTLVEEIMDELEGLRLAGSVASVGVVSANDPVYSLSDLQEEKVFVSVATVIFRANR